MNNSLTVVGLGLIGGSIAKKCREDRLFKHVIGVDNNQDIGKIALNNDVIDEFSTDLAICKQADVIIIATPVLVISDILQKLAQLKVNAIISDVGSVKQFVIESAKTLGDRFYNFVPAHPIAGSEQSGINSVNSNLFINHQVIITPTDVTDNKACDFIINLWQKLGSKVFVMDAKNHDQILAATSHLPHLLAFVLVNCLAKNDASLQIFNYAAGGFRDFTRIAGSDSKMWHDIFLTNKEQLVTVLDSFINDLHKFKTALVNENSNFLINSLKNAQGARQHFGKILAQRNIA